MENWCLLLRVQFSLTAEDAPNRVAVVAIVVILGIDPCTRYVHVVHIRTTIISRRPEVAVDTLSICGTTVVVPRDWRRKHCLHTKWASAGTVSAWIFGL